MMKLLFRDMAQALLALPKPIKFLVGGGLIANFIVIAQWDFIVAHSHIRQLVDEQRPSSEARSSRETHSDDKAVSTTPTANQREAAQQTVRREPPIILTDAIVERNGKLSGNGKVILLWGIKPYDSKAVCVRASGERWACGLQAYATLYNELAKKPVACEPKRLTDEGTFAQCRIDGTDIALLLVQRGLIEINDDAGLALTKAEAKAKAEKLGIWDR